MEEPGSSEEEANPFDLESTDEEDGGDGGVVDRCGGRRWALGGARCLPTTCHTLDRMEPCVQSTCTCTFGPPPPLPLVAVPPPCRQYLEHRAHKLINPKTKGHRAGGSPVQLVVDAR